VRKLDAKPAKPGVAEVRRDEKAGATEPRKAP
jgi:hypothetical protein